MATPTEAWKASLPNLSNEDKAAHAEVINDFFAKTDYLKAQNQKNQLKVL